MARGERSDRFDRNRRDRRDRNDRSDRRYRNDRRDQDDDDDRDDRRDRDRRGGGRRSARDTKFIVTIRGEDSTQKPSSNRSRETKQKNTEWDLPDVLTEKRKRSEITEESKPDRSPEPTGEPQRKKSKKMENCRFFPNCLEGDACVYNHPTKLCNKIPNCTFGDKCLFYHPTPATVVPTPQSGGAPYQKRTASTAPCRYGFSCVNRNYGCSFSHPLESCRYGDQCTKRAFCRYGHGTACKFAGACTRPGCSFTHYVSSSTQKNEDVTQLSASLASTPPKPEDDDQTHSLQSNPFLAFQPNQPDQPNPFLAFQKPSGVAQAQPPNSVPLTEMVQTVDVPSTTDEFDDIPDFE